MCRPDGLASVDDIVPDEPGDELCGGRAPCRILVQRPGQHRGEGRWHTGQVGGCGHDLDGDRFGALTPERLAAGGGERDARTPGEDVGRRPGPVTP